MSTDRAQWDGRQDQRAGRPCRVNLYQTREQRRAYLSGWYGERRRDTQGRILTEQRA
jgi:ribosome modulation factor